MHSHWWSWMVVGLPTTSWVLDKAGAQGWLGITWVVAWEVVVGRGRYWAACSRWRKQSRCIGGLGTGWS